MRTWWSIVSGVLGGLLGAGLIWLIASPPRGEPVALHPPPTPSPLTVHVTGGVKEPGVYTLPIGSRVEDAVQAAGGTVSTTAQLGVNLAAKLEDGDQVWVPAPSQITSEGVISPGVTAAQDWPPGQGDLVNINTASPTELESLPGIGPATAAKIVDFRQKYGPFATPADIQQVSGIGPATFERIVNRITISDGP